MSISFIVKGAGVEYLRKNQITHRDIKPGNIMRKIDENGRYVF